MYKNIIKHSVPIIYNLILILLIDILCQIFIEKIPTIGLNIFIYVSIALCYYTFCFLLGLLFNCIINGYLTGENSTFIHNNKIYSFTVTKSKYGSHFILRIFRKYLLFYIDVREVDLNSTQSVDILKALDNFTSELNRVNKLKNNIKLSVEELKNYGK